MRCTDKRAPFSWTVRKRHYRTDNKGPALAEVGVFQRDLDINTSFKLFPYLSVCCPFPQQQLKVKAVFLNRILLASFEGHRH